MSVEVSVIVAAYNAERTIERAVRSALDQQGVRVEVIAVDDASADGTGAALTRLADPRLKCIRFEKNGGPGQARSAGIAAASGQWIAVLDGDDAFAPGRLERCLARAQAQAADIVVDNLTVRRESDGAGFPMFPPERFARLDILDLATFIGGRVSRRGAYTLGYLKPVFSADFLRRHGLEYDTGIRIGEDYLLLRDALAAGARCAVEPQAGYLYTARAGSISHRLSSADIALMLEKDEAFLRRHALDSAARAAQRGREKYWRKEAAYTRLVEALKRRDMAGAARIACAYPYSVWLLWRPVLARLRRWTRL